jgi:hypothetical protein
VIFRFVLITAGYYALAYGQGNRGTIIGPITDPNGTGIANARVTATNVDRKAKAKTTTTADGGYRIQNLAASFYDVAIEASGFKKFGSERVQVYAGDPVRVDAQIELTRRTESKALNEFSLPSISFSNDWLRDNWLLDPQTYEDASRGPMHHEENGIHACRSGYAMLAVDLGNNALLCHQVTADTGSEQNKIDGNPDTRRHGQHACPAGWYMRGVSEQESVKKLGPLRSSSDEFLLLCSSSLGVTLDRERKTGGTNCEDPGPRLHLPLAVMTGMGEANWYRRSLFTTLCARFAEDPPGRAVFQKYCGTCHTLDYYKVGTPPSLFNPSLFNRITQVQGTSDTDQLKIYEAKHWTDKWAKDWGVSKLRQIRLSAREVEGLIAYIRRFKGRTE